MPETRQEYLERHARCLCELLWQPLLVVLGVITVFWKLALTKQYTFLDTLDMANMAVPRFSANGLRAAAHWSIQLWNPYEFFGQPPIGQVEPAVISPFAFLLALAPLHNGHVPSFSIFTSGTF